MSLNAIRWAFVQPVEAPVKFVLVALADHADEDGTCWPGLDRLTTVTCLSRSTIIRALEKLERVGLLRRTKRPNKSNTYALVGFTVTPAQCQGDTPEVSDRHSGSVTVTPKPSVTIIEPSVNRQRGSRLPADWQPDDELIQWARSSYPHLDVAHETDCFRDYWLGCGKTKADWRATYRNWLRRSATSQRGASITRLPVDGARRRNYDAFSEALARHSTGNAELRPLHARLTVIDGGRSQP